MNNAQIIATLVPIIIVLQELIGKKLLNLDGKWMILCGFILGAAVGLFCGYLPDIPRALGLSIGEESVRVLIFKGLFAAGMAMGLWGTITRIISKVGIEKTKK